MEFALLPPRQGPHRDVSEHLTSSTMLCLFFLSSFLSLFRVSLAFTNVNPNHHMNKPPLHWVTKRDTGRPLRVSNNCDETIYPAIQTQAGTGPPTAGFGLKPGEVSDQMVSENWQGRVWGRTNCSFNGQGTAPANDAPGYACSTGDCGGTVLCAGSGLPPATLAEFTLLTATKQTFYDVSLVDGYNLPMAIISLLSSSDDTKFSDVPPNLTNPICIGTSTLLESVVSVSDYTFGTNTTYPLPLEKDLDVATLQRWCPWDLQLAPPTKPGDGVYPYPDDHIPRPIFNPCYSACAKSSKPQDCCTGKFNSPTACNPSAYSTSAKKICPDAYSYAYDDQSSTFIIPAGGGFEVAFCPRGTSTRILAELRWEINELARTGVISQRILDGAKNWGNGGGDQNGGSDQSPQTGPKGGGQVVNGQVQKRSWPRWSW